MGGKGGGDNSSQMYQPQQSTIDTNVAPVDLRQDQEFIDVQRAAREATAGAQQPQDTNQQPSLGDVAANALDVPDFLLGQNPVGTAPRRRSKRQTTNDTTPLPTGGGSV
jgi:hypothetical protein